MYFNAFVSYIHCCRSSTKSMQNANNILLLLSGKSHVPDKFSSACSVGLAHGWASYKLNKN